MERSGLARRLPAALLDGLFLGFIVSIVLTVYGIAAGTSLAIQARDEIGLPVTITGLSSDEFWEEFERETEAMFAEMEAEFREEFTEEQAEFIGTTMAETVEQYFDPENLTVERILRIDATVLDGIVDQAFDAVIAAERPDISAQAVNELRADVKQVMDRFALGRLIPATVRFVAWLVLIPMIVALAYGFMEAVWGRTLGKVVVGIAIRREDEEGALVPALMLRYAIKYAPLLLALLGVVTRLPFFFFASGIAWIIVLVGALVMIGPERRALHDYAAGTAVYRTNGGAT